MTPRSTAGLGLDPLRWLAQLATEHTRAEFCVAAGVAASPHPEPGLYGRGIDPLALLLGQKPANVRKRINALTEAGWLPVARLGGGRGKPTLFRLDQPGLALETGSLGTGFLPQTRSGEDGYSPAASYETGSLQHPFHPETPSPGNGFNPLTRAEEHGFTPPLLISAGANMNLNVHLRDEVAKAVLEHGLPAQGRELDWLLEGVAERLGEGVPPADLIARFRQRYTPTRPNGWKSAKGAFMALTRSPLDDLERAASGRRITGTPTPPRYVAQDTTGALGPAELAARVAAFRQARGGTA